MEERESQKKEEGEERGENGKRKQEEEEEEETVRDVEKGEMGHVKSVEEKVVERNDNVYDLNNNIPADQRGFNMSMLRTLNPTNPLRIAINGGRTRVAAPTRVAASRVATPLSQPRSTPTPTSQVTPKQAKIVFF